MKYCCICMDKSDLVTKLGDFKDAFVCQECIVTHFEILESGAEITKYYDFVKKIVDNLKTIKKIGKR